MFHSKQIELKRIYTLFKLSSNLKSVREKKEISESRELELMSKIYLVSLNTSYRIESTYTTELQGSNLFEFDDYLSNYERSDPLHA